MSERMNNIGKFLRRQGGVGVIVRIPTDGKMTFTDLCRRVHVSRQTLSTRLDEARELDLVRQIDESEGHGNEQPYLLTSRGHHLRSVMEIAELDQRYANYLRSRRRIANAIDRFEREFEGFSGEVGER